MLFFFAREEKYEKNQSGAGRLFYFTQICAGANQRKEEKWKQSFQPALVQLLRWLYV